MLFEIFGGSWVLHMLVALQVSNTQAAFDQTFFYYHLFIDDEKQFSNRNVVLVYNIGRARKRTTNESDRTRFVHNLNALHVYVIVNTIILRRCR